MTFAEFKVAIRSYVEMEKNEQINKHRPTTDEDIIMKSGDGKGKINCYFCSKVGHKQYEC